jgi:hypothetical protein
MLTWVVRTLQFANLVTAALAAGGQLFCLQTLVAARKEWSPELGTKVHQDAMTERPDVYMKKVSGVALFSGLILGGLDMASNGVGPVGALYLAGALGQVANAVISVRWEWPVNREFNSWKNGPVLERYTIIRDSWDEKHAWRTYASMLALACFVVATLLRLR